MEALLKKILELIVNFFSLSNLKKTDIKRMPVMGERGSHILVLQEKLNLIDNAGLTLDGDFGLKTKAAVSKFQKQNGLSGSGVLGPKTLELLNIKLVVDNSVTNVDNSLSAKVYRIAEKEIGVKEILGGQHNPRILEYHYTTGRFTDDETAWCGSFVNWVLIQAGVTNLGPRGASARAWLTYGKETKTPQRGDLVIFWRVSQTSWQGHVGFYVSENSTHIRVLGGNQSNAVNISSYSKDQLLGFRTY